MEPKWMLATVQKKLERDSEVVQARTVIRCYKENKLGIPIELVYKAVNIIEKYAKKETGGKSRKRVKHISKKCDKLGDKLNELTHLRDDVLFDTDFIFIESERCLPENEEEEEEFNTVLESITPSSSASVREPDVDDFMLKVAKRRLRASAKPQKIIPTPQLPDAPSFPLPSCKNGL